MNNIYPAKEEYLQKAKNYNLIPVFKEYIADTETPASIFIKVGGPQKAMFLLESVEGLKKLSRYSFIGAGSSALIDFKDGVFNKNPEEINSLNKTSLQPLEEMEKIMKGYKLLKNPELNHFVGGAVGYLGYDLVKYFDNINIKSGLSGFPEMMMYLTDLIIVFDHFSQKIKIISTVKIRQSDKSARHDDKTMAAEKAYLESVNKIKKLEAEIFSANKASKEYGRTKNLDFLQSTPEITGRELNLESNFSKNDFIKAVEKAKEHIKNGEAFQIVLSQRFSTDSYAEPFSIYRILRTINPSPYLYFFNFKKFQVIGSSPEPLIKINGSKISTYPIAGTRKRGKNIKEDKILIKMLLNDEKEVAEHNMLVDLARNDLGRVCSFKSVRIRKYMSVLKYSHVIHLLSRVEGKLSKKCTIFDAIKSTFPAGTLSGAPKIRAMQIINELEPAPRGIYGGAIGYFGYDGSLDTCIAIRTAVIEKNKAYVQAGAGIVYDSVPENEYNETLNKAGALLSAIQAANRGHVKKQY